MHPKAANCAKRGEAEGEWNDRLCGGERPHADGTLMEDRREGVALHHLIQSLFK